MWEGDDERAVWGGGRRTRGRKLALSYDHGDDDDDDIHGDDVINDKN